VKALAVILAVLLALIAAVHIGVPALGLVAPVPVLLAFAAVLVTLVFMITATIVRDGLYPVWTRGTA
jgi:hypothetical protein